MIPRFFVMLCFHKTILVRRFKLIENYNEKTIINTEKVRKQ